MSLNKNLLEEINRFRMMSSYEPGKLLNEQKILNEEMFFGKQDKYFLVTYKKNGKPKLAEIGTNIVEENKFLPTEYGKKLLGIEQDAIQFIQLQKNTTFQKYRSVAVDANGSSPRIVTDAELDDFVENLIEKNLNYQQEFLPQNIAGTKFYEPGNNTRENEQREFLRKRWKEKYGY